MKENKYFEVTVKEVFESDNGKKQKKMSKKLVETTGITEAETMVTKLYNNVTFEWQIVSISVSKIDEIVN